MTANNTEFMLQLTAEIQETIATMASNKVRIGSLLVDLHEEFKAQDKPYADFLEYCKATFGLSKSSVSEWCKAARFVLTDPRFEGVAAFNVLRLAKLADSDQIERAAEFALNKSLTNAVLNEILDPKPSKEEIEKANEINEKVDKAVEKALQNADTAEPTPVPETIDQKREGELIDQIKELTVALKEANEANKRLREEFEGQKYSKTLPMLPQFSSKESHVILGISEESAGKVTHVRKAFRGLVAVGYGEGHEAYTTLCEARDKLLAK